MAYILQHTAEAIDDKLNLIERNKNLLPHPYTGTLPTGFEDIGDGSILADVDLTEAVERSEIILVDEANFVLLANTKAEEGKTCAYRISLIATDITEASVELGNSFFLKVTTADGAYYTNNDTNKGVFTLASESPAKVSLIVDAGVKVSNLLLKPQIEEIVLKEGEVPTTAVWSPYMKTIGSYVDERFNSLNTKFNKAIKTDSITVGSTTLTEADIKAILEFMTNYTNYERSDTTADS